MSKTLKLEISVADLGQDGVIVSEFATTDYVASELAKKATLNEDGKVDPSLLPDYTYVDGLVDKLEDVEQSYSNADAEVLQTAKNYSDSKITENNSKKADLVEGKVPFEQLPFSMNFEQNVAEEFSSVRSELQTAVEEISTSVNGVLQQANEHTDSVISEQSGYLNNSITEFKGEVNSTLTSFKGEIDDTKTSLKIELDESKTFLDAETLRAKEAETALQNQINVVGVGNKAYKTYALMDADKTNIPAKSKVTVTNDTTASNNGDWQWDGVVFTKSSYDPLTQAKNYADQKTALKIEGVQGKNLFDKSKVTSGKGLGDAGPEITAATRSVSGFIAVLPNTAYSFTATTKVCFYDSSKNFVQLSVGALANVITNSSAAFMRIDAATTSLDQVQAEIGALKTLYEPYEIVLKDNVVSEKNLKQNSVGSSKIKSMSITARHFDDVTFLNMHNAATLRKGLTLSLTDGYTETVTTSFDVTDFIPCKPNKTYTANEMSRVLFYAEDGTFISMSADRTFTTPTNCHRLRFNLSYLVSYRFQLNEGTTTPSVVPQPYKFSLNQLYIPPQTKTELSATLGRKTNLSDAWYAWRNNEKFPIAFLGDSTTNGNGTTGFAYRDAAASLGQDYIAPNSYTSVFQSLIREITGNTVMRAYNAGFSGRNAAWALANIDAIFGEAYADAKMIGISLGINDRTASAALYASNFYRDIEGIIKWCFNRGIQPFLLTSQPVTIPSWPGEGTGSDIQEVANEIKKNLAAKYDLELVDVSKFGEQFMQYSAKPLLNNIMEANSNVIHFGDGGHKFTAELLFAHFCKRCIWTTQGEQLDYATQLMFSNIEHAQIKQINPFKQGFKIELNTTQATAENKLLQEFWVFNAGRKQLNLAAYYANAVVGQYVQVDGVQTTIASQGQALATLDLGLHKIKAYSSATTALDWLGFKLI